MESIIPKTTEGALRVGLRGKDNAPEKGEHTYHLVPPDRGATDMGLRQEAIASLLQADAYLASNPMCR